MGVASLGGVTFRIDPDAVGWTFTLKTSRQKTLGGTVVQVYGSSLGEVRVAGAFGQGDRSRGDTEGWQEQERFRAQVEAWAQQAEDSSGAKPLRFSYPPRRWDLQVLLKAFRAGTTSASVLHDPGLFNPRWELTLRIVQDVSGAVSDGIRDLYLNRLMDGIGWRQSTYNGPLGQAEVDAKLAGYGGLTGYLAAQFNQAAGYPSSGASDVSEAAQGGGAAQGASVDGWITQAEAALKQAGAISGFSADDRSGLKIIAQNESDNNPRAINEGVAGDNKPSGLMQVKSLTFAANALPGYSSDILDPVQNIIAAVRYILGRYSSISQVPGVLNIRAGRPYGAGY